MKKLIFLLTVMVMTATACGKEKDVEDIATIGTVIDVEDSTPENFDVEPDKESMNNTEGKEQQTLESDMQSSDEAEKQNPIQEETSKEQITDQQSAEQPKEQIQEPETQSVPTATLNGTIISVSSGEFIIEKANVISSDVMVKDGENVEKVSVIYTDSTELTLCTSSDGGVTADYFVASSANLGSGKLVEVEGAYEGNSFVAQKVTIYSFN